MEVRELVIALPKVKDVDALKEYVIENIENFSTDNSTFHHDFTSQKEIIRQYDEILCTKASKVSLHVDLHQA